MNVDTILRTLRDYFHTTAKAGHTDTMLRGAECEKCIVIVRRWDSVADRITMNTNRPVVTLDDVQIGKLTGVRLPLAFDNFALSTLFDEALARIEGLKRALSERTDAHNRDGHALMRANTRIERLEADLEKSRKRVQSLEADLGRAGGVAGPV